MSQADRPPLPETLHLVVGTAGHIDHGKTSLIRSLTGVDLDSLPEEKARGITIALGFTHLDLPSGRRAAFVDVPGHERLVRTMIAGATGLHATMLCVSAVEGFMPQTHEHLAILQLLGVRQGVVVLTMTDLVDDEMLELAQLDIEEHVQGTFLEGAPIIATASGPRPSGQAELLAALDALEAPPPAIDGPFRLPIDRAFVQRGFGTVVTGTIRSGQVSDGDDIEVMPLGLATRARGLQVHGAKTRHATAGMRTAINLAGIERDDLARGMVLTHRGVLAPASVLDVRHHHLASAPPLKDGARARLLIGTAEVLASITVLSGAEGEPVGPGQSALLQLRTEAPLVALPGDRFVLRRESPVETLGGGQVLDPWSHRVRRRDRDRAREELDALEAGDRRVFLARAGDDGLTDAGVALRGIDGGVALGDRVVHPDRAHHLEQHLLDALSGFHVENPLAPGIPRRELHSAHVDHLSKRAFEALIQRLEARGAAVAEGPHLRREGFRIALDADQQARLDAEEKALREAALEGPRLVEFTGEKADLLRLLLDRGAAVRVGDRALHARVVSDLVDRVKAHLEATGSLSPSDFKAITGLSRRHAIPLLEWLDQQRITERHGDNRRLRQG